MGIMGQIAYDLQNDNDSIEAAEYRAKRYEEFESDPKCSEQVSGEYPDESCAVLDMLATDPVKAGAMWKDLKEKCFDNWIKMECQE